MDHKAIKAALDAEYELTLKRALASRIAHARALAQLSVAEVAEHFGVSVQAVYDWEKSDRKPSTPDPKRLHRLAELFKVRPEWLLTGSGEAYDVGHRGLKKLRAGRIVPQVSTEVAASGTSKDHAKLGFSVDTCFPCGPNSYATNLTDKSNAPEYMPGDIVVIDPDALPVPGDMVLAIVPTSTDPVFRRFKVLATQENNETIELIPLNDDWKRYFISDPAHGRILGVMTEHTKPRRQ